MPGASSLWLLEAKKHATEDRSEEACSVQFWIKPGSLVVGRQGAQLPIEEDRSISRRHAELTVPLAQEWLQQGNEPFVLIKDLSKYGTWVSASGKFTEDERLGKEAVRVGPTSGLLRFGFNSPFKLHHQDWLVFLSRAQREAATASTLSALDQAAEATGLALLDELADHAGTRVLALAGSPLRIDSTTLLALLRGYPVVSSNWLLEWQEQAVWRNSRPQESAHPVQLRYADSGGRLRTLPGPAALRQATERSVLAGRTLLWLPAARDAALQEAARLMGAANSDAPASGRGTTAAAKAAGAVLVRSDEADAVAPAYRKLSWTTAQALMAGMLEGSLATAIHEPQEDETSTPAAGKAKGRGGKQAVGTRSATDSKGKGRGRRGARAGQASDGEAQRSGSDTDASEDIRRLGGTQRVLAADDVSPAAGPEAAEEKTSAAAGKHAQVEQQVGEEPPARAAQGRRGAAAATVVGAAEEEAPTTSAATTVGRKRRQDDQQTAASERAPDGGDAAQPTPAKKRRQATAAKGAKAAAASEAVAAAPSTAQVVVKQPMRLMPAEQGWLTSHHKPAEPGEQSAPAASPAKPAAGRVGAKGTRQKVAAAAQRQHSAAAVAAAEVEEQAGAASQGGAVPSQADDENGSEGEAGQADVLYEPLVLPLPAPPIVMRGHGRSNADDGPNFKAFRKGDGSGAEVAVTRTLVAFDAEPYAEEGLANGDAFLKAEAERRQRLQQADELFQANVKARKAAPLPDLDAENDTPPKGRGRGSKKAAAAPVPGQQSMLNFLPPSGPGRGRGRGRGKQGRGKT